MSLAYITEEEEEEEVLCFLKCVIITYYDKDKETTNFWGKKR
jgi:hypothetical protein